MPTSAGVGGVQNAQDEAARRYAEEQRLLRERANAPATNPNPYTPPPDQPPLVVDPAEAARIEAERQAAAERAGTNLNGTLKRPDITDNASTESRIPGQYGAGYTSGSGPSTAINTTAAQSLQTQLQGQYDNPTTRTAPTVGGVTIAPTAPATAGQIAPATKATAGVGGPAAQVAIPTVGPAAQVGNVPQVNAPTVNAPTIAPIERVTAPGLAPTTTATAATVNRGEQGEMRSGQLGLIESLKAAAAGTGGPTAAELLGSRQAEEAISTQRALAAGAHGTGRVTANLRAADNISSIQTKSAADAAILRAKEQQEARGELGGQLLGTRGQDIGLATTEAGFQQQTALANMTAENARSFKDADLQMAARMGNAAAQNELSRRQAELTLAADTTTAGLGVEAQKANQGAAVTTGVANMQAQNRMAEIEAQIRLQGGIANAEQQNELNRLRIQVETQTSIANAAEQGAADRLQGQLDTQTSIAGMQETGATSRAQGGIDANIAMANADNALKQTGLDDAQRRDLLNAIVTINGQMVNASIAEKQLAVQKYMADKGYSAQTKAAGIGAIATLGAGIIGFAMGGPPGAVAGAAIGGAVGGVVDSSVEDERNKG